VIVTQLDSDGASRADEVAAILAAINRQFATTRAHDRSDPAVGKLKTDHIIVDLSRRYVDSRRASGYVAVPGGRAVVRFVATTADNVYVMQARVQAALEGQILATASGEVGPFTFETSDPIGPDDSWLSAADTYTY